MTMVRTLAASILILTCGLALAANFISGDYAAQYREHPNEPPSHSFLLGTDELGRDRFSRFVHGTRISLLCSSAAALIAIAIGAVVGMAGGAASPPLRAVAGMLTDLFLSLPWLFALLALRALLPLNVSPYASVAATFLLLAAVGWASGARVVQASVNGIRFSPALMQARAAGCGGWRLVCFHVLPNLRHVLIAQFWILVPVFLLTEANLGILGLGVMEPVPSWGNILAELQNYRRIPEAPWILVPAVILVVFITSLHVVLAERTTWQ
jgi:peptide/nickel transport system permease protein